MIVIQARLSSTRFPNKILHPLLGKPIIDWVLEACLQAKHHKFTCLATPDTSEHDQLWEHVRSTFPEVLISTGPEDNVHRRCTKVLTQYQQQFDEEPEDVGFVRVCADRPLLSSQFIDALLHRDECERLLYNHVPPPGIGGPRGLGAESLSKPLAKEFFSRETDLSPYDQEHVTSALYRNRFVAPRYCPPTDLPVDVSHWNYTFDLDDQRDIPWIEALAGSRISRLLTTEMSSENSGIRDV